MTIATPIRLQSNAVDCGAVCLGIVLEYHGFVHSSIDLRKRCAVGRDGATVAQIQRGAEALGHHCRITKKGIESLRKAALPLILHWDMRHFVVLEGMSGSHVWINDPAAGRRKLTRAEFDRHFTGVCLEIKVQAPSEQADPGPSWRELHALAPKGSKHVSTAIAVGLAASGVVFLIEVLFGGFTRAFFDYVVGFQIAWWGYVLACAGVPVLVIRFLVRHIQSIRLENQALDMSLTMKRAFLDRLYAQPTVFFDAHFAAELFGRLRDLDQCLRVSLKVLNTVIAQAAIIVATTAVLLLLAPVIALVHLVPRLGLMAWMSIVSRRTRELELRVRDESSRHAALQAQRASGYVRFFAGGQQDHLLATCLPVLGAWQAAKVDRERHFIALNAAQRAMEILALPLSAFAGSYLLIQGELTYGGFMLATALAVILTTNLSELFATLQEYKAAEPIVRRVAEVVEEAERDISLSAIRIPGLPQPEAAPAVHVDVNRLGFGYNGLDADLFSNLSFTVRKREVVNIAGQSGAGKSTLLDLIAGLRRPVGGQICFNGELLKGPAPAGLVVADDQFIIGPLGSFVANGEDVDPERLTYVLKFVELWDRLGFFVEGDGKERLEEQGLSRGEVQRLILAQALYRSDECLLFDEAFTHLSLEQSVRILERLRRSGTTVLMATHRPEIQALCDRTILLKPQPGRAVGVESIPHHQMRRGPSINGDYLQ